MFQDKIDSFFESFNGESPEGNIQLDKYSKKIIGVYGTQGGVGVSSFIYTLANALTSKGNRVLIIDGNLLFPYFNFLYNSAVKEDKISLKDYLVNPDIDMHRLFIDTSIDYLNVTPFNIYELTKLNEDTKSFENVRNILVKAGPYNDIILIDLNVNLANNFILQGFIKEIQYLIKLTTTSPASRLNSQSARKILNTTIDDKTPEIEIVNKVTKPIDAKYQLPYKSRFEEFEEQGKCYLYTEDETKDDYTIAFNNILDKILVDIK